MFNLAPTVLYKHPISLRLFEIRQPFTIQRIRRPQIDTLADVYRTDNSFSISEPSIMATPPRQTQTQDSNSQQTLISFLDLPPPVAGEYILSGLVRFCPISLNTAGADQSRYLADLAGSWAHNWWFRADREDANSYSNYRCFYRAKRFRQERVRESPEGFDCICMPVPITLLRISKAVYREVSSILYSENKFRISRSDRRGLSPLFALNSVALQSPRSLSIRLNACPCIPGYQCPRDDPPINGFHIVCYNTLSSSCHRTCKIGTDSPATISHGTGQALLSE